MKMEWHSHIPDRTVVIGAGMAGLAAAISLSSRGEEVILLESCGYPGGKMREVPTPLGGIDSGPTVFTMKYVFEELFDLAGTSFQSLVEFEQAEILARHSWDDAGTFDLHACREKTAKEVAQFFDSKNADGYLKFCNDAGKIFETLKDTYIGASRPNPFELGNRVGFLNLNALLNLKPLNTLMKTLSGYFPDQRLQQLFGRYATYVGSSPYLAPATLMLIAHVEQEGVWLIKGGMHRLAKTMAHLAELKGTDIRKNSAARQILLENGRASGVLTESGEIIAASKIVYCGDVSQLTNGFVEGAWKNRLPAPVPASKRSLSAITWSMEATCSGVPLHRHNVFFSRDYLEEFESIFERGHAPIRPTVYVCAQDRHDNLNTFKGGKERLLCLINAPANGDTRRLSGGEVRQCEDNMKATLEKCGLKIKSHSAVVTQPADFNSLFPGSGGALYGRASHGWMTSFARPGSETKIPGLYLAGGSVHPGPGVPMATRSGMLAAEQILRDRVLT